LDENLLKKEEEEEEKIKIEIPKRTSQRTNRKK